MVDKGLSFLLNFYRQVCCQYSGVAPYANYLVKPYSHSDFSPKTVKVQTNLKHILHLQHQCNKFTIALSSLDNLGYL